MQAAQHADVARQGMIVLDEMQVEAHVGKGLLAPDFREVAAVVGKALRAQLQHAVKPKPANLNQDRSRRAAAGSPRSRSGRAGPLSLTCCGVEIAELERDFLEAHDLQALPSSIVRT